MESTSKVRGRIPWVDTLRFLGIYSIYLAHYGEAAPRIHPIIFIFAMPLFFGLSGGMEAISTEKEFWPRIFKKIKTILLPYFFFIGISLILATILNQSSFPGVLSTLREILVAQRNTLFAPMLWFLPALFLTELIFMLMRLVLKPAWALLLASTVIYIFLHLFMHDPLITPQWFWNLDTSLFYLFYYALGYWGFPKLLRVLGDGSKRPPLWFTAGGMLSAGYSLALLFDKEFLTEALAAIDQVPVIRNGVPVANALIIIWALLLAALILQPFKLLQKIGRETLYLCGNEYIVKLLLNQSLGLLGLAVAPQNPLAAYLLSFFLILAAVFILIPFERRLYQRLLQFFGLEKLPAPGA